MRIGIMLRHYDQHEGGVKVYTRELLPLLFSIGSANHFVLVYQNPKLVGTYAHYDNVDEVAVGMPGTVLWDQIAVPWVARRKHVDLIFNPKFAVPFLSRRKKVFVLHGSEWFVIPEYLPRYRAQLTRILVTLYCRHADAAVAVSSVVKADVVKHTGICPSKVVPIHNGFHPEQFKPVHDSRYLDEVRDKYRLPERFILWVGQIDPRKNLDRLIHAFAQIRNDVPHLLVLAGEERRSATTELRGIQELGISDRVRFTGWVPHRDLPGVYSLADLLAFPSIYEGFGIPLIEAMACGCPIVTANTCSPPEVTDGAAYLVNPLSQDEIAAGMRAVLLNPTLRQEMIAKGLVRAQAFSWEKCARELLAVFDSLHT